MSYTPTIEDLMCLLLEQPEKFSARLQTQRSLINAANQPASNHGAVDATVRAHYADYLRNGGEPLTETRVPQIARLDDTIHDTEFGAANCDCVSLSPCCLINGKVVDATDPTRKVEWPNAPSGNQPKTLWLIADSQEGNEYYAEVEVAWQGSACRSEYRTGLERQSLPSIQLARSGSDTLQQPEQSATHKIYLNQSTGALELLRSVLPDAIVFPLAVVDRVFSLPRMLSGLDRAHLTPRQCAASTDMNQVLQVAILPEMRVDGDFSVGTETVFSLNGIRGEVSVEGNLTGKIAQYEINYNANSSASGDSNERAVNMENADRAEAEPGFLGLIGSIFKQMSQAVSRGSAEPSSNALTSSSSSTQLMKSNEFTSSITLYKTLKVKVSALELKRQSGTPNLELAFGTGSSEGITTSLSIGVKGKIDLVDLLVRVVARSGRVAREIQELRFRTANGETVSGGVEMNLTLAAEGEVEHNVSTQVKTITVTTQEDLEEQLNQLQHQFTGRLSIVGEAEIKVHLEARYLLVSARAGINGSLHTSWTWEVQNTHNQRQKRFYFEGLRLSVDAYAEVIYEVDPSPPDEAESDGGGRYSRSRNVAVKVPIYSIDERISQSREAVKAMRARHEEQTSTNNESGNTYEILEPTVTQVTADQPAWQDF
ncbi:MAG: hypothetical protein ACK4L8_14000 [Nitrincola lacisaponensis]|uniref:hypothetical protein n=1 Tax=Nitrincola lacisaponensis TaxID=267850 RepID=UPI00391AED0D